MILVIHLIYVSYKNIGCLLISYICFLFMISFPLVCLVWMILSYWGHPFGGCAFTYNKSLSHLISHHNYPSNKFCAISLSVGNVYLLLICVYFPTNYHTSTSRDAFNDVLSESEDFIDSVPFQHIIIGGDFNVDLNVSSYRNSVLKDFFHERNFIICFPPPVLIILLRVMLAELILGLTTSSVMSLCSQ